MKTAGTLCVGLGIGGARDALAQNADILPPPALPGGKTLEEALRARQSIRSYADKDIPAEVLSGLLWAACGVNRKESGKRTAPSAVNKQEIDVWVVKKDGFFLYEPKDHMLSRKGSEDIRALTATTLSFALMFLNATFTVVAFSGVRWSGIPTGPRWAAPATSSCWPSWPVSWC